MDRILEWAVWLTFGPFLVFYIGLAVALLFSPVLFAFWGGGRLGERIGVGLAFCFWVLCVIISI